MSGFAPRAPPLDVRRGAPGQISPTTASPPTGAVGGSSPPQRAISVPAAAAPSPARENARAKVQQAVEADVRGDYAAALKLYQEAVDGFKLQVAAEHNPTTKAYLETKMREYAARAAKLMQFLGQAPEPRTESVSPTPAGPPRQPSGGLSPDAARTTHGLSFPQTQQLGPSLTHRAQPAAAASGGPPLGGPPLGRNDPPSGISTGVNPMRAPSGSLSSRPVPAQAAPWSIPPPMQSAPSNINVLDPARDEKSTDSKPASPKLAGLLPEAGIAANEKSNISVPSKPRKGSWLLFFVKWSFLILTGWAVG